MKYPFPVKAQELKREIRLSKELIAGKYEFHEEKRNAITRKVKIFEEILLIYAWKSGGEPVERKYQMGHYKDAVESELKMRNKVYGWRIRNNKMDASVAKVYTEILQEILKDLNGNIANVKQIDLFA